MEYKATLQDFIDVMNSLENESKEFRVGLQNMEKLSDLIYPYIHMTKEGMEAAIPDGIYEISAGRFIGFTGKQGLVNVILEFQKPFNNED